MTDLPPTSILPPHRTPLDIRLVVALAGGRALNAREQMIYDKLVAERGESVFADMLTALTHHTFPTRQAKHIWGEVLAHRSMLTTKLGRDVGLPVAAHDYLANLSGLLKNTTLIEEEAYLNLARVATHDGLTGLFDQTTFARLVADQLALQARHGRPCTLVVLDVDHFKRLNDTFGHADGDTVLAALGKIIRQHARISDLPGRTGGEEFALLLPEVDARGGDVLAERLRAAVEQHFAATPYRCTISLGVASVVPQAHNDLPAVQEALTRAADVALYAAKQAGRNRVVVAPAC